MSMEISIQTDRKKKKSLQNQKYSDEEEEDEVDPHVTFAQDKKLKRLTQVNRQLIERLKQQNDELTKKINKQKFKPGRSPSIKPAKNAKETESIKKQLQNAYKQIDMYKTILTGLKAKQVSVQSIDKVKQLEVKVKEEDNLIEQYQKQLKYIAKARAEQEKQLKIYENDEVKHSVAELERQVNSLKDRIKIKKKTAQKRDEVEKKQHTYQLELELALRKINDEYYPGKVEKVQKIEDDEIQITERQWQTVRSQLAELKRTHQENTKKIETLTRQKNRQVKSYDENQLKIKQKNRKLQTLRNKVAELSKLATIKESNKRGLKEENVVGESNTPNLSQIKKSPQDKNRGGGMKKKEQKKEGKERQIKKWMIPQGYCLEKGKIQPDSIFFSDKTILRDSKKTKIIKIHVWADHEDIPNVIQFIYQNENEQKIQGIQPIEGMPPSLELSVFRLKDNDYLHKIKGSFLSGELVGIHFISKFGKELKLESDLAQSEGESFIFEPRPNEIPSLFYGAYVRKDREEIRICHLGVQFMTDW